MKKEEFDNLVKKALMLDTKYRTQFLDEIDDERVKKKLTYILSDASTDILIHTNSSVSNLDTQKFMTLVAGEEIKHFTIIKLLAKGGMGCVYLAYDNKLARNVAIKTIVPEHLSNNILKQRLKTEAQVLSKINHPAICQIYDYFEFNHFHVLVLELIEGQTLTNSSLNKKQLLDVFIQIASGLKIAHEKHIIHRDLKPDNIMISKQGKTKILDFGIAKPLWQKDVGKQYDVVNDNENDTNHNLTKAGSLIGTLLFMSPEQAAGKETTTASDIYSFALVMHKLICKKDSYEFDDTNEFIEKVKNADIQNLDYLPKEYQSLIYSMLNITASNRPTAKQVKEKLLKIKDIPSVKKKKKITITIGLLVTILLTIVAFQWKKSIQSKQKSELIQSIKLSTKEIAEQLNKIYTLPLHPITKEIDKLNKQKNDLINSINRQVLFSNREKQLLKGRIYLAHKDYKHAQITLDNAWKTDNSDKQLAKDLAYLYSSLYLEKSRKHIEQYGDSKPKLFAKLSEEYLKKITYYKINAAEMLEENSLPTAAILWQEGKNRQALKILESVIENKDWMFGAFLLKAMITKQKADKMELDGDIQNSYKGLQNSLNIFQQVKIRARSYPNAYAGLCLTNFRLLSLATDELADSVKQYFQQGIMSCENLLILKPDQGDVFSLISQYYYWYAYYEILKGNKPLTLLNDALFWNKKAKSLIDTYRVYINEAEILALQAQLKFATGKNPLIDIENALTANLKAIKVSSDKNTVIYSSMLYIITVKLNYQLQRGVSMIDSLKQIQNYFDKGYNDGSNSEYALRILTIQLANAHIVYIESQIEQVENPLQTFNFVESLVQEQIERMKNQQPYPDNYKTLAKANYLLSKYNINQGIESSISLNKALKNADFAIALLPGDAETVLIRGLIYFQQELNNKIQNNIYKPNYNKALEQINESLSLNPNSIDAMIAIAEINLTHALHLNNVEKTFDLINKSIAICDHALLNNPNHAFVIITKAKLIKLGIEKKLFDSTKLSEVKSLFAKAQQLNPKLK